MVDGEGHVGDRVLRNDISRRSFLVLAGLSAAAGLTECRSFPETSPARPGPYQTDHLVLGGNILTAGMAQPLTPADIPIPVDRYNFACRDGAVVPIDIPARVRAVVHHPVRSGAGSGRGPFPVLLYAHGVRDLQFACQSRYPVHEDFTQVDTMLQHVASYGCVAVAPDLSWLAPDLPGSVTVEQAFSIRARVLVAYFRYLQVLDGPFFANRMDFSRVLLVGHSTGAGSSVEAGRLLLAELGVPPIAYGLIGPYYAGRRPIPGVGPDLHNVLVMHGTRDAVSGNDAAATFAASGTRKTLVTIPGANHFGYTNLCEFDDTCRAAFVADQAGTILRDGQQRAGSAYLAALLRYYALGDATARPYLTGEQVVGGLDTLGVTGVQVQQDGV
jgi:hypothetical protein